MSNYGRNFGFRIPPYGMHRPGRYVTATSGSKIPLGAPVKIDTALGVDSLDRQTVVLATGAQAPPKAGAGILVYEYAPAAFAGVDPALTLFSDLDTAPKGAAVQVISHRGVKVWLANTEDTTVSVDFTGAYGTQRIMVAGLGATPTVAVGDMLSPGTGNDSAGYWVETGSAANAWLVVTHVDTARHEVEAEIVI